MHYPSKHLAWFLYMLVAATLSSCTTTSPKSTPRVAVKRRCPASDNSTDVTLSRKEYCDCTSDTSICAPNGPLDQWSERISFAVKGFSHQDPTRHQECVDQSITARIDSFYFALATACVKQNLYKTTLPPPPALTPPQCEYLETMSNTACLNVKTCVGSPTKPVAPPICLTSLAPIHSGKVASQSESHALLLRPLYQYQNPQFNAPKPCLHATNGCDPNYFWLPNWNKLPKIKEAEIVATASTSQILSKRGYKATANTAFVDSSQPGCIAQKALETQVLIYQSLGFCTLYQLTGRDGPARLTMQPCPQVAAEYRTFYCPK